MWGRSWLNIRDSNIGVETLLFSCSILGYYQRYQPFQLTIMSRMGECDAQDVPNTYPGPDSESH